MISPSHRLETFAPAPCGNHVRLMTGLAFGVGIVVMATAVWTYTGAEGKRADSWAMLLPAAIAWVVIVGAWLAGRIRAYEVGDGTLVVIFAFHRRRFPLAGLQSAMADRNAMARALRVFGNGGLGSISGRFRNKALGPFRAYVTGTDNAVVLRWPGRCVVVSPDRVHPFVDVIHARAGLKAGD